MEIFSPLLSLFFKVNRKKNYSLTTIKSRSFENTFTRIKNCLTDFKWNVDGIMNFFFMLTALRQKQQQRRQSSLKKTTDTQFKKMNCNFTAISCLLSCALLHDMRLVILASVAKQTLHFSFIQFSQHSQCSLLRTKSHYCVVFIMIQKCWL